LLSAGNKLLRVSARSVCCALLLLRRFSLSASSAGVHPRYSLSCNKIFFLFLLAVFLLTIPAAGYETIAVIDFYPARNTDPDDASYFSDLLRIELQMSDDIIVLDKSVTEGLSEFDIYNIASDKNFDMAKQLGADKLVLGKISRFSSISESIYINLYVLDPFLKEVVIMKDYEIESSAELGEAASLAARNITGAFTKKDRSAFDFSDNKVRKKQRDYFKFAALAGYPYIGIAWNFFSDWSIEPRFAFDPEIKMFGIRISWRFRNWSKTALYSGLEYYSIRYDSEGMEGKGSMAEIYLGGEFSASGRLKFFMDMGPAYLYLKENEYDFSISRLGDIVLNTGVKYYFF